MIRRAQIKFIAIIMSILLCVFAVISAVAYFIMLNTNERAIDRALNDTEQNFLLHGGENMQNNGLIAIITAAPNGELNYSVWFDQDAFNSDIAHSVIERAFQASYVSGSVDNIYYKITDKETHHVLVAADMSETMAIFSANVLKAFTYIIIIYFLLFLIVWRLSFSVFNPIREAFYKQKQFISNASHELKTPLTIISANADALKNSGEENCFIENIKSQTQRLDGLVADMLTLAKMDEGKNKILETTFNISDEILSSILPFDAVAFESGKTLTIDIEENLTYKGDVQSVKKLTNILLDNAIKHASNSGEIHVSLKKENGKIIFTVFNTGSSIPFEESDKVFERFYRGDQSRSRDSGGSGLGLSIAKSVADGNKWKIHAISRLNESMTITVTF